MITQQLLSRAKTLTIFMKDGGLFFIYNTVEAAACRSQRCVNANWGEADGNMSLWEYAERESQTDGRTAPYLTEARRPDHGEFGRTGLLVGCMRFIYYCSL